jgi:hypothetical protein
MGTSGSPGASRKTPRTHTAISTCGGRREVALGPQWKGVRFFVMSVKG